MPNFKPGEKTAMYLENGSMVNYISLMSALPCAGYNIHTSKEICLTSSSYHHPHSFMTVFVVISDITREAASYFFLLYSCVSKSTQYTAPKLL